MNLVVSQTQLLRNAPIRACHSETRSLDCLVKLLVSIVIFDRKDQVLACECPLVGAERENSHMSYLSWLVEGVISRERQLAFRTQVKPEFNFFAVGVSFRLRRDSPFLGLDLIRKVEAVKSVS